MRSTAREIGIEEAIDEGVVALHQAFRATDAGIVDQDVDATQRVLRRAGNGIACIAVRHALDQEGLAEPLRRRFHLGQEVDQQHPRAVGNEALGNPLADPACGARDDGDLAGEACRIRQGALRRREGHGR